MDAAGRIVARTSAHTCNTCGNALELNYATDAFGAEAPIIVAGFPPKQAALKFRVYRFMRVCVYGFMRLCVYAFMRVLVCVCVCVCVRVCVWVSGFRVQCLWIKIR